MMSLHDEIWAAVPEGRRPDPETVEWALEALSPTGGVRVLDVGCGDGHAAAAIARAGADVTGVDPSQVALERARSAHPQLELARPNDDGTLPLADAAFDAALCVNVLEHVADTQRLMSELRRVLRSGGRVALVVPHNSWLTTVIKGPRRFKRAHDPLEPVLRHYTARTLRSLLERFGFERISVSRSGADLRASSVRA